MDLRSVEEKLGYSFHNASHLEQALSHSSYVNELGLSHLESNERFEFLGDAVLNLVVGHLLMELYPDMREGDLSRMRAGLVNETQLSVIARRLELGSHVRLSRGEIQTNGRKKKSILADTMEAVIAAVYLDSNFETAFAFIQRHFTESIASAVSPSCDFDYKSRLQELTQVSHGETPAYNVVDESGPDHDKTFVVEIETPGFKTFGVGKSKKTAEQDAARKALDHLSPDKC